MRTVGLCQKIEKYMPGCIAELVAHLLCPGIVASTDPRLFGALFTEVCGLVFPNTDVVYGERETDIKVHKTGKKPSVDRDGDGCVTGSSPVCEFTNVLDTVKVSSYFGTAA